MILSVDLAARFSACTLMNRDREVILQWDSVGASPSGFATSIFGMAELHPVQYIVIEDVPYGISKQSMIKPVLRLQGRILQARDEADLGIPLLFTTPDYWMRHFHLFGSKSADQLSCAAEFGYEPPDVKSMHEAKLGGLRGTSRSAMMATLRKAKTDYVASYLIARWAWDVLDESGDLRSAKGIQEG